MSWEVLKSNIFDYISDSSIIKTDEQISYYVSNEISNYIQTNIKTSFGNPISIDQFQILGLIKSCEDTVKNTIESFPAFNNPLVDKVDVIKQFMDMKNDIISNIPEIPEKFQNITELLDGINPEAIKLNPEKFNTLLKSLSNNAFDVSGLINIDISKLSLDQISNILDNIKDVIQAEIDKLINFKLDSLTTTIPFAMDYGIQLNIEIPEIDVDKIQDILQREIENNIKFKSLLSNPLVNVKEIIENFLLKVDVVENFKNSIIVEIDMYYNKINELVSGGINIDSPIIEMYKEKINKLQDNLQSRTEDIIKISSPVQLPSIDGILKPITDTGLSIITSATKIIPTNSAIPGGIPISEQVTFPGFDGGLKLDSGENVFYMAFLDMFKQRLENTTVVNVSNYNNTIIPVTGNIIVT